MMTQHETLRIFSLGTNIYFLFTESDGVLDARFLNFRGIELGDEIRLVVLLHSWTSAGIFATTDAVVLAVI